MCRLSRRRWIVLRTDDAKFHAMASVIRFRFGGPLFELVQLPLLLGERGLIFLEHAKGVGAVAEAGEAIIDAGGAGFELGQIDSERHQLLIPAGEDVPARGECGLLATL